ncbi:hypothetical protein [Arenimonas sp. MALMAid1274]|uniref:hypothetical protein n=1 Tax=Arenimonas sp. MALMAid1274 TaxID=3411630 RepID=UPI003B9DC67C
MSEPTPDPEAGTPGEGPTAPGAQSAPGEAGKLGDDAKAVLEAAKQTVRAYTTGFTTLRRLFAAEVGLARDALVLALVYLLVATVMLGTAYLLLTALLVSGLRAAGAPWPLAIFIPLAISVAVAWVAIVKARAVLKFTDFEATRRQLKRDLGSAAEPEVPL